MTKEEIKAHLITKPIQLLAAWLTGLAIVNGLFLTGAATITFPSWVSGFLVVASIINVPLFLISIFLLQTKFRPEMQEDTFYSKYLDKKISKETLKPELIEGKEDIKFRKSIVDLSQSTLDSIDNLQLQVISIRNVLDRIAESSPVHDDVSEVIANLKIQSSSVQEHLIQTKQKYDWANIRVLINDLLPNYGSILSALEQAGVVISDTFGSSSEPPTVPEQFILTFGKNVPVKNLQFILRILLSFDVAGICYTNREMGENTIYVGGYSYEHARQRIAPLGKELLDTLLANGLDFSLVVEIIGEFSSKHALSAHS